MFTHLHHFGMDVEAGVTQLSDLLGQELHPLGGVTEDDRLVDLKLSHGDKRGRLEPNKGSKMFFPPFAYKGSQSSRSS